MCSDDRKCSRRKSSRGDSQYAPRPGMRSKPWHGFFLTARSTARVPLSTERPSRVAVPAHVRVPLSTERSHRDTVPAHVRVPLSTERAHRDTFPAQARVPLSTERSSRVAVPAQVRHPSPRRATQTQNSCVCHSDALQQLTLLSVPLSVLTPRPSDQRPVNTYKQPNPWTPEMELEYDEYKAADVMSGVSSSSYKRERTRRLKDDRNLPRHTYTPMGLTQENHYELLPMAVDWEERSVESVLFIEARIWVQWNAHWPHSHHRLRKGFNDAYPRAYESPAAKQIHEDEIVRVETGIEKARDRVAEHGIHQ